jgi:DNA modification methylase
VKIEDSGLRPDTLNANEGTQRGLGLLDKSLRQLGAGRSILVDAKGNVIAGNKTLERAADIDLPVRIVESDGTELIAVKRTDLDLYSETDKRARQLAYADNKVAELDLAWKPEQIAIDFEPLDLGEWGFEAEPEQKDAEPQIDRAAELNEKWKVVTGDLWQIGEHRLLCGDSTKREDVDRVMGGELCGACVTDSPYGINREGIENDDPEGLQKLLEGVLAVMPIENAVVINFQSPRLFPVWLDAIRKAGHKFERALWMYDENDQTKPWRYWLMCSQIAIISTVGKAEWLEPSKSHHDTYVIGLSREWRAGGDGNEFAHASVKPVGVIQDIITHIDGDVYEPFCGSGTTMVACENLHRKCRAIEISPNYCAVILQRMEEAFGITGVKIE